MLGESIGLGHKQVTFVNSSCQARLNILEGNNGNHQKPREGINNGFLHRRL
jgi:hypothetical protein